MFVGLARVVKRVAVIDPGRVHSLVQPVVCHLERRAQLPNASRIRTGFRTREGVAVEYPYFDLLGHQVWGATAMILGEFICVLQT